jgi:hypothetical protein
MKVNGQPYTLAALPQGKKKPLERGLGGPQSRSGRCGEETVSGLKKYWETLVPRINGEDVIKL